MFGIRLGRSCDPGPHHLGSLSLLEDVLVITSGCLLGIDFTNLRSLLHFLCVFVCWG